MSDLGGTTKVVAGLRLTGSAVVGLLAAAATIAWSDSRYALGIGWSVACLTWLLWLWLPLRIMSPSQTRAHAVREDPTRGGTDVVIILAALASLGAVFYYLSQASKAKGADEVIVTVLGMLTIALSWFVIHSMYALRYARLYYGDEVKGIDFNSDEDPDYRDFAYFSFNLGMTYQVSDTNVTTKPIRRTVLRHCLLSFLFGVAIFGAAINIIAGLGGN